MRTYNALLTVSTGMTPVPSPMGLPLTLPVGVECREKLHARFSVDFIMGYMASVTPGNCVYQVSMLLMVERTKVASRTVNTDAIFVPFSMAWSGVLP
ncbi:hypothetical protein ALO53_200224 [Pseudomonas amygdali pv. photiniae]|uniref:Uncharacterized protein n=1 Tax=Pseudomonas amygdali pv. photiniae TaxID=251724 RepID=A0A0P9U482_PSEA0|nr:hypothetical protein ALO53_200224 [Pseudomonas amygdali pv. photiniae]